METRTQRFEADTLVEGLDVYGLDFVGRLHFSDNIYNIVVSRGEGVGPRYGMAPIPGHCHTESLGADLFGGLQHSEGSGTYAYENRKKSLGIVPITVGTYDDINTKKTHFIFVNTSLRPGSVTTLDYSLCSDYNGGSWKFAADIAEGFNDESTTVTNPLSTQYRQLRPTPTEFRTVSSALTWCRTVLFNHQGKNLKKPYWVGPVDPSYPDTATRFGLPGFGGINTSVTTGYGHPPGFNFGNWSKGERSILAWSVGYTPSGVAGHNEMMKRWSQTVTISATSYLPTINSASTTNLAPTWPTATPVNPDVGARGVTGNSQFTLFYDPELTCGSQYQILLSAPGKAVSAIIQEHERDDNTRSFLRWIDLTSIQPYVRQRDTRNERTGTQYVEQSRATQTCWAYWPSTDYGATTPTLASLEAAGFRDSQSHVCLGPSGSGILRGNSTYEFAFSVYDYTLDYETNVGVPARVYTGTDDGVCLYLLLWPTVSGGTPNPGVNEFEQSAFFINQTVPFPGYQGDFYRRINYLEYRVYYRELGTFEWLPAGNISATEVFYHPDKTDFAVCENAIAALPGGQPGAFNDYSNLPEDQWIDVAAFNSRVFWVSKRQMVYSLRDNPLAYPARNSLSCPKGEFRGCIVHTFKGEAEQTGRLIIFGSQETYFAEFNGSPILAPVRVSADSVGEFPLDGSDLRVRLRSTITAFSSKAAVVADGILFFWGPQGIFADDGVDLPIRMSRELEPDLFSWYDLGDTDGIFAHYNQTTKEVLFFFTPAAERGSEPTHALVFNTKYSKWLYHKFDAKIDWAQDLVIDNTDASRPIDGTRVVVGTRNGSAGVISRPMFFDHRNNSGDMSTDFEFVVKSVTLVSGTTYEFTLAAGYSGGYAGLQPGDTFSTPSMADYTEEANSIAGIWAITSVPGSGVIRATKPGAGTQFVGTLDQDKYFPIYTSRYNAIDWLIETNQWAPGGMRNFYRWYFFHLVFLVDLLDSSASQAISAQYRTNVSAAYVARGITLTDNSNGYFQVLSQMIPTNAANFGQSWQLRIVDSHIGGLLLLQYIGIEGEPVPLTETQWFEG